MADSIDLFAPVVAEALFHPQFRDLRNFEVYAPARVLMNELYDRMGDPNGSFVRNFQTQGFHAQLHELACYAYLRSADLTVDRSYQWPDFMASRAQRVIAVEAVTANPSDGARSRDISIAQMQRLSQRQIDEKVLREFPRKMGNSLRKKLAKRYHAASHVAGRPIVLMIAPCYEPGAGFFTDDAFMYELYGPPDAPHWQGRLAFFRQQHARPISAVLYCNAFTVSRFLRLAVLGRANVPLTSIREGVCYMPAGEDVHALRDFRYQVGDPLAPTESWSEGVTLFLNPFADIPLPETFLPATSVISVRDGCVTRDVTGFHPLVSFMVTEVPDTQDHAGRP